MLSPNIYRTASEALESFDYFSEVGKLSDCFSLLKIIWSNKGPFSFVVII
jgi:hypothetical protein